MAALNDDILEEITDRFVMRVLKVCLLMFVCEVIILCLIHFTELEIAGDWHRHWVPRLIIGGMVVFVAVDLVIWMFTQVIFRWSDPEASKWCGLTSRYGLRETSIRSTTHPTQVSELSPQSASKSQSPTERSD